MKLVRIGLVGAVAGVVLGGLVVAAGCEGSDDAISGEEETELQGGVRFHRRHRGRDAGSVGGSVAGTTGGGASAGTGGATGGGAAGTNGTTTDGGPVADCDVCTRAQQCCGVVQPDRQCSFSAATCASMVGDARPAYVRACLTFLWVTSNAWSANPPAECR